MDARRVAARFCSMSWQPIGPNGENKRDDTPQRLTRDQSACQMRRWRVHAATHGIRPTVRCRPTGHESPGARTCGCNAACYLKSFQNIAPTLRCRPDFVHGIPVARETLRFAFVIPSARFQLKPPLFIVVPPEVDARARAS